MDLEANFAQIIGYYRIQNVLMDTTVPCRTLYVRNLPENCKKQRLRKLLHAAFSPHGRVVYLSAETSLKLRGQAFLTYENLESATTAVEKMNATQFLGKKIVVTYSRQLSDRAGSKALGGEGVMSRKERAEKRKASKVPPTKQESQPEPVVEPQPAVAMVVDTPAPRAPIVANRILFVEDLTDGGVQKLQELFAKYSGFVEVRSVPGKTEIAFVEYGDEAEAAVAMGGLQGHVIGDSPKPITISFAKK